MIVLIVLFGSWLILRGIGALGVTALVTWHDSVRYALAVMFVFTGGAHFNKMRRDIVQMIPSFFPEPMSIVYITGVAEFLGATGLLIPRFRALAGVYCELSKRDCKQIFVRELAALRRLTHVGYYEAIAARPRVLTKAC
ncbi:MAG TPA: DoxX family protein [Candidatus Sulfotelmatobacter sp.]|nr:DoxX family protein [Candidatus Sulfotelmatobacter sp.]